MAESQRQAIVQRAEAEEQSRKLDEVKEELRIKASEVEGLRALLRLTEEAVAAGEAKINAMQVPAATPITLST